MENNNILKMLIDMKEVIIPIITSIIGFMFGGYVSYRYAVELEKRKMRISSGAKLIAAFSEEWAMTHEGKWRKDINPEIVLQKAYIKHKSAAVEFGFWLSNNKERKAFDNKWKEYCEIGGSISFINYMMGENPCGLFQERVSEIFKFVQK